MKRFLIAVMAVLLVLQGAQAQSYLPVLTPLKDMKGELHPAKKNGKWGFANTKNKFVIKPVFDEAENFIRVGAKDGTVLDVAKVKVGSKWGYISRESVYFIEPAYDFISDFDMHSVAFARNGAVYTMYGVEPTYSTNLAMKVLKAAILESGLSDIPQFSFRGHAVAAKGGRFGIIDITGTWLVPNECDNIVKDNTMSMYRLERRGLIGYATYEGKTVFPAEFKSLTLFAPGLFLADKDGLGLYKTDGSPVIPTEYDVLEHFNDYVLLKKEGRAGLASIDGKMIIPVEYEAIAQMSDGNFMVKGADGYNVYGPDCVALFPISFDSLELDEKLGYIVQKDGLYGRLDDHGAYMYPCRFETVPDPQQKGYVEMYVDGVPSIFLAGESEPRSVADYDDALYRSMSDRSYAASTLLPAWLKGHLGRGRIANKVLLESDNSVWVQFKYDEEDKYRIHTLKCGKKLAEVMPFEGDFAGENVCDRGDLVLIYVPEPEFFGTLYVYDTASGKVTEYAMGDQQKVYSVSHGIVAESMGSDDARKMPVETYININPGMAAAPPVCYAFHEWAGVIDVLVCLNGGKEYVSVKPGVKVDLMNPPAKPEYDSASGCVRYNGETLYNTSGSYYTFEMLVHEPAENGISVYEIIGTRHYWRLNWNVVREIRKDNPVTLAYGYIGMGCEYFVQPLFVEAKGFEGATAEVRIGEEWKSFNREQIAAFDPFILPL